MLRQVGDDLGAVLLDGLTVKECLGFVNDKTKLVVQVRPIGCVGLCHCVLAARFHSSDEILRV